MRTGSALEVTLLHAFEIPATWYGGCESAFVNPPCFQSIKEDTEQRLREYTIDVPEERIERVIAEGNAAWHISEWASEHDVDLIVMGTHGYGKVRELLLGSVTSKVLHDVSCPVLTDAFANLKEKMTTNGFKNPVCALDVSDEALPVLFTQDAPIRSGSDADPRRELTDLFNRGKLTARVGTVVPLEQARTAHEILTAAPAGKNRPQDTDH